MYMEDLSSYTYHACNGLKGVLPVGWLSSEHPFNRGSVPAAVLDKLTYLAISSQ
ncbi:MAG: hypothetical protein IPK82_06035 [Polyangiaceae bacterium]|nr:hypothetical protein [Polyangiaceae bacterium]